MIQTRQSIWKIKNAVKLVHNVYGQKQAGCVWNKYMDQGMKETVFKPSSCDPCLYYRGSIVFLVYIDDFIIFGTESPSIDAVDADLRACSHRFTVDDQRGSWAFRLQGSTTGPSSLPNGN